MHTALVASSFATFFVTSAIDVNRMNHNGQPFLPVSVPAAISHLPEHGTAKQYQLEPGSHATASMQPMVTAPSSAAFVGVALAILSAFSGLVFMTTMKSGFAEALGPRAAVTMQVLDALVLAGAVAVDGIAYTIASSVLPELVGGSMAQLIFFARPVVALLSMVTVTGWLQTGVQSGRLATGMGLLLLSCACLVPLTTVSGLPLIVGHAILNVSSGIVLLSALQTVMLQAPCTRASWNLDALFAASAASLTFGPWVGNVLRDSLSEAALMVFLAGVAAVICCALVLVSCFTARSSAVDAVEDYVQLGARSALQAMRDAVGSSKQLLLLGGILLSAALLSLQGACVPLYLSGLDNLNGALVHNAQLSSGVVLVFTILSCGAVYDMLSGPCAVRSMVVGLVLHILGLRLLIQAQGSAAGGQLFTLIGLFASHCGLGMYLGFALPTFMLLARGRGYAVGNGRGKFSNAASASCALAAMWLVGDTLGMGFQLVLCPVLGLQNTIMTFATALLLHTFLVLMAPRRTCGTEKETAHTDFTLGAALGEQAAPAEKAAGSACVGMEYQR